MAFRFLGHDEVDQKIFAERITERERDCWRQGGDARRRDDVGLRGHNDVECTGGRCGGNGGGGREINDCDINDDGGGERRRKCTHRNNDENGRVGDSGQ